MNFKTFSAFIVILILAGIASAAYATFVHSAFKIGDGKDIDLNSMLIGNGRIRDVTCVANCTGYGAGSSVSTETNASNLTVGTVADARLNSATNISSLNRGKIVIYPISNFGGSRAYYPNGTSISCAWSTTSCIQEALNAANSTGFDVHVVGGSVVNSLLGSLGAETRYDFTTPLYFPDMNSWSFTTGHVAFNFSNAVGNVSGIVFRSCMMCYVEIQGQIFNNNNGTGTATIEFAPNRSYTGGVAGIIDSKYYINSVSSTHQTGISNMTQILFNVSVGNIVNSNFEFSELNDGDYGISIPNASKSFGSNDVKVMHIHNIKNKSVSFLDLDSTGNRIYAQMSANAGFEVNGTNNQISVVGGGTASSGLTLLSNSKNNAIIDVAGNLQITNNASQYSNDMFTARVPTLNVVSIIGSPAYRTNTFLYPENVLIGGGTVSEIAVSTDNITFYTIPGSSGYVNLLPGMTIKITYSAAPAIESFS